MARTLASSRTSASNRVGVQNFPCSLYLSGSTSYVNGTSPLTAPSAQTISFWVKPKNITGAQTMFGYYNGAANLNGIQINNSQIRIELEGTTGGMRYFAASPSPNQWLHIAYGYNTLPSGSRVSSDANLWINGLPVTFSSTSAIGSAGSIFSNFVMGQTSVSTNSNSFTGNICGLKIFNSLMTNVQIQQLYATGTTSVSSSLMYLFNEGAGTTAYDTSGNANNGTITSGTYNLDVPSNARALVGNNLVYNGNFEFGPPSSGGVATTTNGKWIDGTAGGTANSNSNDIFGWQTNFTGTCAALFDSANAHSGNYALKVSTTATASKARVLNGATGGPLAGVISVIPILPSTSYIYSFWMKTTANSGSATTGAILQATQRLNSGSASNTFNLNTGITTTTGWTQYTGTFATGATNGSNWILLDANVTGNDGTATLIMDAWFDDIVLTPTTNTTRSLA